MKWVNRTIGFVLTLLLLSCAQRTVVGQAQRNGNEFVGCTPGEDEVRAFVGGLAADAICHSIIWKLTLFTNQHASQPADFRLDAQYQVPTRSNPNLSENGPSVALSGKVEISTTTRTWPESRIYKLVTGTPQRSL